VVHLEHDPETTMPIPTDVDRTAPVLTHLEIDIQAPRETVWRLHTDIDRWATWQTDITASALLAPLKQGSSFRWSSYGMDITSTVYAIDDRSRILWGGDANGIAAIHEWTFNDTADGTHVTTTESFAGDPVVADVDSMRALLDQSLRSWLGLLKAAAEQH
jgi:uncharacterized protein YndB with AHSA1/START domain